MTNTLRQAMLETLWQYESDLLHPPTGDSLQRRLERVRKVIARAEETEEPQLLEWLKPFALVAERDIGEDEDDADLFCPIHNNHAPRLTVGDFRRASAAVAKAGGAA